MSDNLGVPTGGLNNDSAVTIDRREHEELLAARRFTEIPTNLQLRIEYNASGTEKYIGHGPRGLATSANGWLLHFLEYNGSSQLTSRTIAYDSWDNRATATYA